MDQEIGYVERAAVGIRVRLLMKPPAHDCLDPELLAQLSPETSEGILSRLDLSARELPLERVPCGRLALAEKHRGSVLRSSRSHDDGDSDIDHFKR